MRYFFFVYSYYGEFSGKGNFCLMSEDFPSQSFLNTSAVEQVSAEYKLHLKGQPPRFKLSPVIENWIEMSEEDYNNFISKI